MRKSRSMKPAWILIWVFACFVLVPAVSSSADWAGVSKKLTDRCANYEKEIKDMTADMEMTTSTPDGAMTIGMKTYLKGEHFRGDIVMKEIPDAEGMSAGMVGMTMVVVGDGKQYWMISSMMGKQLVPEEEAQKYGTPWRCGEFIPGDGEIVGSETISGRDCHVVLVKDSTSEQAKLWLDKETLEPLKAEAKAQDEKHTIMLFQDYRKVVGDLRYPYKTEMYQEDKLVSTIIVKSVVMNKGLSDALFDPDKVEVKGPSMEDMMKKMQEQKTGNE